MKIKVLLALFISLFLGAGCQNKEQVINEAMKEYVTDYYETYIKGKNYDIDIPEIYIKNLRNATQRGYDLNKLSDCKDSSYATLILDENENITSIELHMNCK